MFLYPTLGPKVWGPRDYNEVENTLKYHAVLESYVIANSLGNIYEYEGGRVKDFVKACELYLQNGINTFLCIPAFQPLPQ